MRLPVLLLMCTAGLVACGPDFDGLLEAHRTLDPEASNGRYMAREDKWGADKRDEALAAAAKLGDGAPAGDARVFVSNYLSALQARVVSKDAETTPGCRLTEGFGCDAPVDDTIVEAAARLLSEPDRERRAKIAGNWHGMGFRTVYALYTKVAHSKGGIPKDAKNQNDWLSPRFIASMVTGLPDDATHKAKAKSLFCEQVYDLAADQLLTGKPSPWVGDIKFVIRDFLALDCGDKTDRLVQKYKFDDFTLSYVLEDMPLRHLEWFITTKATTCRTLNEAIEARAKQDAALGKRLMLLLAENHIECIDD